MSHMRKKGSVFGAVAVAAALALSACGSSGSGGSNQSGSGDAAAEAAGGTITAAAAYETTNYDPSSTSSALAMVTNWQVMEGLYELEIQTFEPYRALAAEEDPVQVSDTEYEVSLREGPMFSNGTPVTSEDVVESFKRATAEGQPLRVHAGLH